MAKFTWDQSFLDTYSDPRNNANILETPTLDPVLFTCQQKNNMVYYQNFSSNPFDTHQLSTNVKIEKNYQNLLRFHKYINTNPTSPYSVNKAKTDLNNILKINLKQNGGNISKEHLKAKLKYLFDEINRKTTSPCQDNAYLNSSHFISSYCCHSEFKNDQIALLDNCHCLKTKSLDDLKKIEPFLPKMNIQQYLRNSFPSQYGLIEILESNLKFEKNLEKENSKYMNCIEMRIDNKSKTDFCRSHFTEKELNILKVNLFLLFQCGFYHGKISSDEAAELLSNQSVGTFFLRDSSNPKFLLSLSFKTIRGPTSIRIQFENNFFTLETDIPQPNVLDIPRSKSILGLIQHFVQVKNTIFTSNLFIFLIS